MPMKLADMPTAFSLDGIMKGYFPTFFNKKVNYSYKGPMPPTCMYRCDSVSQKERTTFLEWYNEEVRHGKIFDFDTEIVEYCRNDVRVLREACMKFRALLLRITSTVNTRETVNGIDSFNNITIAGVCSTVYRANFLQETWEVRLEKDGDTTEWMPATKKTGVLKVQHEGNGLAKPNYKKTIGNLKTRDLSVLP